VSVCTAMRSSPAGAGAWQGARELTRAPAVPCAAPPRLRWQPPGGLPCTLPPAALVLPHPRLQGQRPFSLWLGGTDPRLSSAASCPYFRLVRARLEGGQSRLLHCLALAGKFCWWCFCWCTGDAGALCGVWCGSVGCV